ncbi:hypothetical protein ACFQQB_00925 [Nonomuraea rubra]
MEDQEAAPIAAASAAIGEVSTLTPCSRLASGRSATARAITCR